MYTAAALLPALLAPFCAWAGPVRVADPAVGVGSNVGGVGVSGAGASQTGAGLSTSYGFNNPSLAPNFGTTMGPAIVRPNGTFGPAAAAVANPGLALPSVAAPHASPASSFAAPQPGAAPAAQPDAAVAGAEPLPGALPQAGTDPKPGPGGLSGVDAAVKDLAKAKKDEAGGASGVVAGRLDALFDFARGRGASAANPEGPGRSAAAAAEASAVRGLPDPKVVGVEPAYSKIVSFARSADSAEAPALYDRAVEIAREGFAKPQAAAREAALRSEAAKRAPEAVQGLAEKAVAAASKGRTSDAIRYAKAVDGWDAFVGAPGQPYILDMKQFTGVVKHVLARALETPGRQAAAPSVRFEPVKAAGRAAALRARFRFARAEDGPVQPLPAGLAANLALPELKGFVAIEGVPSAEGPALSAAFAVAAQAGLAARYRAARAAGRNAWSGFWVAARGVAGTAALTLWEQVKVSLIHLLQALGVLHSASPAGPVVRVDAALLSSLRASVPERVELAAPPAAAPDALGLGYRLVTGR